MSKKINHKNLAGEKILSLSSGKNIIIALSLCMSLSCANAAERLVTTPDGVILRGAQSYSRVVMTAYQKTYAMNFDIWQPRDLPSGWYATFDGYPVAQIAENRWVYGKLGVDGAIQPTNILVGSVIPMNEPELLRIAAVWSYGLPIEHPEFMKIREKNCNRMGWLKYGAVNTLIAWNNSRVGVWIWLGNRWRKFTPVSGEYTWEMLKRLESLIAEELRKNNAWYYGSEPLEVADLARRWGYIWGGQVILTSMRSYWESSGGSDSVTSMHDNDRSGNNNNTPPENNNNNGQWDVD